MSYGLPDIAVKPCIRAAQQAMGTDSLWTGKDFDRAFDRFAITG